MCGVQRGTEEICIEGISAGKAGLSPGMLNCQPDREVSLVLRDSQTTSICQEWVGVSENLQALDKSRQ